MRDPPIVIFEEPIMQTNTESTETPTEFPRLGRWLDMLDEALGIKEPNPKTEEK